MVATYTTQSSFRVTALRYNPSLKSLGGGLRGLAKVGADCQIEGNAAMTETGLGNLTTIR